MYVRHAKNISVRDLEMNFLTEDKRPAIVLDDVAGIAFDNVSAPRGEGATFFVLRGVKDFAARNCAGLADTKRESAESETL
jgi:hypothetical protein